MQNEPLIPPAAPLSPHFCKSLLIHSVAFGLIFFLLARERQAIVQQEQAVIDDIRAQEERLERAAQEAQEEAVKEMLRNQLKAEFDTLLEDELNDEAEEELSADIFEDIDSRIEALDDLSQLTAEEIDALLEQLRNAAFEKMMMDLEEMQKEMLMAQVRQYVRSNVAPQIKNRIEYEFRNRTGETLRKEAEAKSWEERKERLADAKEEIQKAVKELKELKRAESEVSAPASKSDFSKAAKEQQEAAAQAPKAGEAVKRALETVEKQSPRLAESAKKLREGGRSEQTAEMIQNAQKAIKNEDRKVARKEVDNVIRNVDRQIRDLESVSRGLDSDTRSRSADEIQKAVVAEALKKAENEIREEVTERVKDKAIPIAANKITDAVEKDLTRLHLNQDEFKDFLKKDISRALDEELTKTPVDAQSALSRTRDSFDALDLKHIEEAREEISKVIKKFEASGAEQSEIKDEVTKENADAHSEQQRELAIRIGDEHEEALDALTGARSVSYTVDRHIDKAVTTIERSPAQKKANEAEEHLKANENEQAQARAEEVSKDIENSVNQLKAVDAQLASEAGAAAQMAEAAKRLQELAGEEIDAAAEGVSSALAQAAQEHIPGEVERGANAVRVQSPLGTGTAEGLGEVTGLKEKLMQVSENLAEGRGMGLGELPTAGPPGGGMGPGIGVGLSPYGLGLGRNWHDLFRFNREAYEEFIKDLRDRVDPTDFYAEVEEDNGPETVAAESDDLGAARIYVETIPVDESEPDKERTVPEPTFKTKAFGAAAMVQAPITIDGDLSDWGELRHPIQLMYRGHSPNKIKNGPKIYMRWDPEGLYFCYRILDPTGIQKYKQHAWMGDGFEAWIDMDNSRLKFMETSKTSHQFCFMPFGVTGNPKSTFSEVGRGLRGLDRYTNYVDSRKQKGFSAGKVIPGGYQVEAFVHRRALARPSLIPGRYLAMNFSINLTKERKDQIQWSATKEILSYNKPDTWGDLLLLGSDGKARLAAIRTDEDREGIVPGDVLEFEVTDQDMNLNPYKLDRVSAELRVKGPGISLFVVLKETARSSGIFSGSVDTQQYFKPVREAVLNLRSGDTVRLVYHDVRTEFGEKNRKAFADLSIGYPMVRIGKN